MYNIDVALAVLKSPNADDDNVRIANAIVKKEFADDDTIVDDIKEIMEDLSPVTKLLITGVL